MTPAATVRQQPAPAPIQPETDLPMMGLRIVLILVAVIELFDAFSSVPILFGDMSEIPGPGFGGFLVKARIATHPLLALAALILAAMGHVRHAIIALAAVVIMTWLNFMPSVVRHGLEFKGTGAFETPIRMIAFPLMAACAIAYAARNERLRLAAALVTIPTVLQWLGVLAFAIGVMIYGF